MSKKSVYGQTLLDMQWSRNGQYLYGTSLSTFFQWIIEDSPGFYSGS